jgi:hypothetical protein
MGLPMVQVQEQGWPVGDLAFGSRVSTWDPVSYLEDPGPIK